MNDRRRLLTMAIGLALMALTAGCASAPSQNGGDVQSYPAPAVEAGWIRNGQPIQFEGDKWYPVDDYEVMSDSEVYEVGEYRGVQVFVAKIDTQPYSRIYTKFDKNKFRYWERRDYD
ncbi:MAG: hypothetical protein KGJ09_03850 [Candidatus Omnitrophica bacterium]|nr:hypothetical protein [Candidatus Omnitrophota bacterium]MDE2009194.1 hypothetical protein [Candidatus Omnitrophota bacterium]MDE2213715.1 hypothetical protein [Candidatus Omnitrophota bacterium]MDE2230710.1 hypothetical protein [Candidatus Omnitrophota bacterium]